MQAAVIILLFGVLLVATACFAVMGLAQVRRTRALARVAHEMGFQFSPDDPFDVPRRYADMALVSSGHSPRANNVAYGRLVGLGVRAFDFRYEVGHGPKRITKRYSVFTAEVDRQLPSALIWHLQDEALAPLSVRLPTAQVDCWSCTGDEEFARQLVEACRPLAEEGISAQTQGATILLCAPVRKEQRSRAISVARAAGVLRDIETRSRRGE